MAQNKIIYQRAVGLGISLAIIWLWGCELCSEPNTRADQDQTLSIATWNLQALFDGSETGFEYDEYLAQAGWTGEKYRARLTAIAQAVGSMTDKGPDVLAFQELENAEVLQGLAEGALAKYGYQWTFFANNPGYSLGIGVLSRFPLTQAKVHSVTSTDGTTPRPVLEVWVQPRDKSLALFVCHWKSKVGGDDATEALRRSSARAILRRLQEIEAESPGTPVLIMGDLNENHDEFYRRSGSVVSALLPDDPKAAELARMMKSDFLVISQQKPPAARYFGKDAAVLYSPWGTELQKGSYNYKNAWETIDHFLLNGALFDHQAWDFDTCEVLSKDPFITAAGYPNTYNPQTGYGLSDHLPLLLRLKLEGD